MDDVSSKLVLVKKFQGEIKALEKEIVAKQEMLNSMMKDFAVKTLGLPEGSSFELVDLLTKAYEAGKK